MLLFIVEAQPSDFSVFDRVEFEDRLMQRNARFPNMKVLIASKYIPAIRVWFTSSLIRQVALKLVDNTGVSDVPCY